MPSRESFGFKVVEHPSALMVLIDGDIDLSNASSLQRQLESVVDRDRHVVVDLVQVAFLDLSALRAIEAAHRRARGAGRRLVLVGSKPHVRQILEVAEVTKVVPVYASREEALGALEAAE